MYPTFAAPIMQEYSLVIAPPLAGLRQTCFRNVYLGAGISDVMCRESSLNERQSVAGSAAWDSSSVGVMGDPGGSELSDSLRPLSHLRKPARI